MSGWVVSPLKPRGPVSTFDDEPRTSHASIAESWAHWRMRQKRAPESVKFAVTDPRGVTREFVTYREVIVAPVYVDRVPTLDERQAAEIRACKI